MCFSNVFLLPLLKMDFYSKLFILFYLFNLPKMTDQLSKLRLQLFQIFLDQPLSQKFQIGFIWTEENLALEVNFVFTILDEKVSQSLTVRFPGNFPEIPPRIVFQNSVLSFIQSQLLNEKKWRPQTCLKDYLQQLYDKIKSVKQSDKLYQKSTMHSENDSEEPSSRNSLSEEENDYEERGQLSFLREKLKEVVEEHSQKENLPQRQEMMEKFFRPEQTDQKQLESTLQNSWVKEKLTKEMENGKFMNRIYRGNFSMKVKMKLIGIMTNILSIKEDQNSIENQIN